MVIGATWLYNYHPVPRIPAVNVTEIEKPGSYGESAYLDVESVRTGRTGRDMGRSTSRPGTPVHDGRHHFRTPSARRDFEKRDV